MPKGPTTDAEIVATIPQLAMLGHSAREIHRIIHADPRFADRERPALRTVQAHVSKLHVRDSSGIWSLAAADPETSGLVLDALATIIDVSEGRVTTFTVAEAAWIEAIHRARRDIPAEDAWYLSRFYVTRERHNEPTDDLDAYLAYAPWRDNDARERYITATIAGHIPAATIFLATIERGAQLHDADGNVAGIDTSLVRGFAEGPEVFRRRRAKGVGR